MTRDHQTIATHKPFPGLERAGPDCPGQRPSLLYRCAGNVSLLRQFLPLTEPGLSSAPLLFCPRRHRHDRAANYCYALRPARVRLPSEFCDRLVEHPLLLVRAARVPMECKKVAVHLKGLFRHCSNRLVVTAQQSIQFVCPHSCCRFSESGSRSCAPFVALKGACSRLAPWPVKYFLGIKIVRSWHHLGLSSTAPLEFSFSLLPFLRIVPDSE